MSSSPSGVTIQDLRNALISLRETGQLEHFLHETFQSHETAGGTMSDSSKRRAEALESEEDEFDVISSVSMKQPPVRRVQTGGSQGHLKVTEPEKKFPEGIQSLEQWGSTICDLPKVQSREMSYENMIEESKCKKEMADYLSWVFTTKIQSKKADDLLAYLSAMDWNPKSQRIESTGLLTYPGTTMVRRMKN